VLGICFPGKLEKYKDGLQHDSHEFLMDLLDQLDPTVVHEYFGVDIIEESKYRIITCFGKSAPSILRKRPPLLIFSVHEA